MRSRLAILARLLWGTKRTRDSPHLSVQNRAGIRLRANGFGDRGLRSTAAHSETRLCPEFRSQPATLVTGCSGDKLTQDDCLRRCGLRPFGEDLAILGR